MSRRVGLLAENFAPLKDPFQGSSGPKSNFLWGQCEVTMKISSISVHNFLSYLHTNEQMNERTEMIAVSSDFVGDNNGIR